MNNRARKDHLWQQDQPLVSVFLLLCLSLSRSSSIKLRQFYVYTYTHIYIYQTLLIKDKDVHCVLTRFEEEIIMILLIRCDSRMTSDQVRPVIECFCQILSFYGFSPVDSDTFQSAKFDRPEAVSDWSRDLLRHQMDPSCLDWTVVEIALWNDAFWSSSDSTRTIQTDLRTNIQR